MGYFRKLFRRGSDQTFIPSISIVMPSYNQSHFIRDAIKSVLSSGVENIELIIADGGSTDGTLRILESFSAEPANHLRWISEKDKGAASAVNKAILLSQAPIIGWLNSDDLYEQSAISDALKFFSDNPNIIMVYSHAKHIDETGKIIGEYPTKPPNTDILSFRDGCFICQPTVFMRRKLFEEIGMLDEKLQTSFDFDFWIRAFKKYQAQIGFLNKTSAYSRLHDNCMTVLMRKNIAIEAMQLLARHFGTAPSHWLLTYFDEIFEYYPHTDSSVDLPEEIDQLYDLSRNYLDDDEYNVLGNTFKTDARFKLLHADACINIYADGWLPPLGCLRVRAISTNWKKIKLICYNDLPYPGSNIVTVLTPWGENILTDVKKPGEFTIDIHLPGKHTPPAYWSFIINSENYLVPHDISMNNDKRKLSFQIKEIRLIK